jgi:chromosome segregation ATPase
VTIAFGSAHAASEHRRYVEELEKSLHREYPLEAIERKMERAERRRVLEDELQRLKAAIEPVQQNLTDEHELLQQTEQDQQRELLVSPRAKLELLEAAIGVSRKRIAALTAQYQEQHQALEKVQQEIAAIDRAEKQAEEDDRIAALINRVTAEFRQASSVANGIQLMTIYRCYRELVKADSRVSSTNSDRLTRRADQFDRWFREKVVEEVFNSAPHTLEDQRWEHFIR